MKSNLGFPPVEEWERFDGTPKPGVFFTFDLSTTRRKLLESGRLAKITLKSGTELASLQYRCVIAKDRSSGMCHIRELPPEKADIENWLANLPRSVEWCGEGIPALTQKCLLELLKAEFWNCRTASATCVVVFSTATASSITLQDFNKL